MFVPQCAAISSASLGATAGVEVTVGTVQGGADEIRRDMARVGEHRPAQADLGAEGVVRNGRVGGRREGRGERRRGRGGGQQKPLGGETAGERQQGGRAGHAGGLQRGDHGRM